MYLGKLINIDFSYYLVFLSFCMPYDLCIIVSEYAKEKKETVNEILSHLL